MHKHLVRLILVIVFCAYPRGAMAQNLDSQVPGAELTAAVNDVAKNIRVEARIFIPDLARRVRAVIVITNYARLERGSEPVLLYESSWRSLSEACQCALLSAKVNTIRPIAANTPVASHFARNAAMGGADALLKALQSLGNDSLHPELKDAPLLFFGWSATADFGTSFAELHPDRTIGFVRYHTHRRGVPANIGMLRNFPALFIAGGRDETAGVEDAETLWRSGRSARAPWTFVVEPDATHGDSSEIFFRTATTLMVPWVAAVLQQRLPADGFTLQTMSDDKGWLGNNGTADAAPQNEFRDSTVTASWLPDEASAHGWRAVLGKPK